MTVATVMPHGLVRQDVPVDNNGDDSKKLSSNERTPYPQEVSFDICAFSFEPHWCQQRAHKKQQSGSDEKIRIVRKCPIDDPKLPLCPPDEKDEDKEVEDPDFEWILIPSYF